MNSIIILLNPYMNYKKGLRKALMKWSLECEHSFRREFANVF